MQNVLTYEALETKTNTLETHQSRKNAIKRKESFVYLGNLLLVTDLKKEVKINMHHRTCWICQLPE